MNRDQVRDALILASIYYIVKFILLITWMGLVMFCAAAAQLIETAWNNWARRDKVHAVE